MRALTVRYVPGGVGHRVKTSDAPGGLFFV